MASRRFNIILWGILCALIFVGVSSIELTVQAEPKQLLQNSSDIAFVFDLNGVLFDTNKMTVFRQLGMKDVLAYLARHRSSTMLKDRFYETLHRITQTEDNAHGLKDPDGAHMPHIMVEWLAGTKTSSTIISDVTSAITAHPEWFINATEQRLMKKMVQAIFDPEKFVASRKLLPDLMPLIATLKNHGAQLYVLSNWDKESFTLLKKKHQTFFDQFDGHIISGDVGHVKPQADIFSYLKSQLPNKTICFLDDQHENIQAGKNAGLHTILVSQKSGYLGSSIDLDTITHQSKRFLTQNGIVSPSTIAQKTVALS